MTFVETLRKHAKKRAHQRFDLNLTTKDLHWIRQQIRDGRAEFIKRTSLDRSLFRVSFQGKRIVVVYSRRHREIVTVLPDVR